MQSLIASRLIQHNADDSPETAGSLLETIVSSISRFSGYAAMGIALAGIAFLIF